MVPCTKSRSNLRVLPSLLGEEAGQGLFTAEPILMGSKICEYTGTVLCTKEALKLEDKSYLMRLGPQVYVDAQASVDVKARFINDCRNRFLYNVEFEKHPELEKAFVIARRNIVAGEELFVDYGRWYWLKKKPKCLVSIKLPPEPI